MRSYQTTARWSGTTTLGTAPASACAVAFYLRLVSRVIGWTILVYGTLSAASLASASKNVPGVARALLQRAHASGTGAGTTTRSRLVSKLLQLQSNRYRHRPGAGPPPQHLGSKRVSVSTSHGGTCSSSATTTNSVVGGPALQQCGRFTCSTTRALLAAKPIQPVKIASGPRRFRMKTCIAGSALDDATIGRGTSATDVDEDVDGRPSSNRDGTETESPSGAPVSTNLIAAKTPTGSLPRDEHVHGGGPRDPLSLPCDARDEAARETTSSSAISIDDQLGQQQATLGYALAEQGNDKRNMTRPAQQSSSSALPTDPLSGASPSCSSVEALLSKEKQLTILRKTDEASYRGEGGLRLQDRKINDRFSSAIGWSPTSKVKLEKAEKKKEGQTASGALPTDPLSGASSSCSSVLPTATGQSDRRKNTGPIDWTTHLVPRSLAAAARGAGADGPRGARTSEMGTHCAASRPAAGDGTCHAGTRGVGCSRENAQELLHAPRPPPPEQCNLPVVTLQHYYDSVNKFVSTSLQKRAAMLDEVERSVTTRCEEIRLQHVQKVKSRSEDPFDPLYQTHLLFLGRGLHEQYLSLMGEQRAWRARLRRWRSAFLRDWNKVNAEEGALFAQLLYTYPEIDQASLAFALDTYTQALLHGANAAAARRPHLLLSTGGASKTAELLHREEKLLQLVTSYAERREQPLKMPVLQLNNKSGNDKTSVSELQLPARGEGTQDLQHHLVGESVSRHLATQLRSFRKRRYKIYKMWMRKTRDLQHRIWSFYCPSYEFVTARLLDQHVQEVKRFMSTKPQAIEFRMKDPCPLDRVYMALKIGFSSSSQKKAQEQEDGQEGSAASSATGREAGVSTTAACKNLPEEDDLGPSGAVPFVLLPDDKEGDVEMRCLEPDELLHLSPAEYRPKSFSGDVLADLLARMEISSGEARNGCSLQRSTPSSSGSELKKENEILIVDAKSQEDVAALVPLGRRDEGGARIRRSGSPLVRSDGARKKSSHRQGVVVRDAAARARRCGSSRWSGVPSTAAVDHHGGANSAQEDEKILTTERADQGRAALTAEEEAECQYFDADDWE
ncbi:unnamed protein product [Amoebophrya sp. A120]|nr:unnamed protein product [Amoebophrya sp. A120]|eukprot:GSA120T00024435001.1